MVRSDRSIDQKHGACYQQMARTYDRTIRLYGPVVLGHDRTWNGSISGSIKRTIVRSCSTGKRLNLKWEHFRFDQTYDRTIRSYGPVVLGNDWTWNGSISGSIEGIFLNFFWSLPESNLAKVNPGKIHLDLVDLMSPSTKTSKIPQFWVSTLSFYFRYLMYTNIRTISLSCIRDAW